MRGIQGFTLVELSIVIIIIGFLIAGVAAGTSLIKQAELNSVITDFQGYQTSYNDFLSRYAMPPGDFNAAGSIWPQCTTTPTNCNGNGNGIIDLNSGAPILNEGILAWRQLSLANMISSGIQDPLISQTSPPLKIGTSNPASKVGGAGYMMFVGTGGPPTSITAFPAAIGLWNDSKTNAVFIGKPVIASLFLNGGALKAEDAFNIDKKLDDGAFDSATALFSGANTGFIRTVAGNSTTDIPTDCLTGGNSTTSADYAIGGTAGTSAACVVALGLN